MDSMRKFDLRILAPQAFLRLCLQQLSRISLVLVFLDIQGAKSVGAQFSACWGLAGCWGHSLGREHQVNLQSKLVLPMGYGRVAHRPSLLPSLPIRLPSWLPTYLPSYPSSIHLSISGMLCT